MDAGFGERTGFVRTKNIHTPQVVNGFKPFYDHLLLCHACGASSQGHGNNHRQEFGSESYGKSDGKKEGFEPVPMEKGIDQYHKEDEENREPHNQESESLG